MRTRHILMYYDPRGSEPGSESSDTTIFAFQLWWRFRKWLQLFEFLFVLLSRSRDASEKEREGAVHTSAFHMAKEHQNISWERGYIFFGLTGASCDDTSRSRRWKIVGTSCFPRSRLHRSCFDISRGLIFEGAAEVGADKRV